MTRFVSSCIVFVSMRCAAMNHYSSTTVIYVIGALLWLLWTIMDNYKISHLLWQNSVFADVCRLPVCAWWQAGACMAPGMCTPASMLRSALSDSRSIGHHASMLPGSCCPLLRLGVLVKSTKTCLCGNGSSR